MSDFLRLEILREALRLRNFSRVAEVLHISQPSVSSHIRWLENTYGSKLFHPSGRGVVPTEAARCLEQYARRILELRDESLRGVKDLIDLGAGTLRVGGGQIPAVHILPAVLEAFRRLHPGLQITMRVGNATEIERLVVADEVDVGMISREPRLSVLMSRPYGSYRLIPVVAPNHPLARRRRVTPAELTRYPLILREKEAISREAVDAAFLRLGIRLEPTMEFSSEDAIRASVAAGLGVGFLSQYMTVECPAHHRLVTVTVPGLSISLTLWVMVRRGHDLTAAARRLWGFLSKERGDDRRR